jgi:DNA-binding IclR family transcriptional regulator
VTDYLSFLAPPDAVSDWRMVVLYEAAAGTGLLEVIAGAALTPAVLAERLGLDQQAVRVVIEALAAWEVVDVEEDGRVVPGPAWPQVGVSASLRHHARALRSWSANLDDRLRGTRPD